ncbi:MAG: hypothetical protein PHW34_13525 [Hespellia sp.]|nr:hypothetical protein [Hespellia sp.]
MGNRKQDKITVEKRCPQCKQIKSLELSETEYVNLLLYEAGEGFIQDMLPNIAPPERELLKGGMCGQCWRELFGPPPWESEEEDDTEEEDVE